MENGQGSVCVSQVLKMGFGQAIVEEAVQICKGGEGKKKVNSVTKFRYTFLSYSHNDLPQAAQLIESIGAHTRHRVCLS